MRLCILMAGKMKLGKLHPFQMPSKWTPLATFKRNLHWRYTGGTVQNKNKKCGIQHYQSRTHRSHRPQEKFKNCHKTIWQRPWCMCYEQIRLPTWRFEAIIRATLWGCWQGFNGWYHCDGLTGRTQSIRGQRYKQRYVWVPQSSQSQDQYA